MPLDVEQHQNVPNHTLSYLRQTRIADQNDCEPACSLGQICSISSETGCGASDRHTAPGMRSTQENNPSSDNDNQSSSTDWVPTPRSISHFEYDLSFPPYNPLISSPIVAINQRYLTDFNDKQDFRVSLPDLTQTWPSPGAPPGPAIREPRNPVQARSQVQPIAQSGNKSSSNSFPILSKTPIVRRTKPKPLTLSRRRSSTAPKSSSSEISTTDLDDFSDSEIELILFLALHGVSCKAIATEVHRSHACSSYGKCPCNHVKNYETKILNQISVISNIKGSEQDAEQWIERMKKRAAIECWEWILKRARELASTNSRAERMDMARDRVALKRYRLMHENQNPTGEGSPKDLRAYQGLLREAEDLEQAEMDREQEPKIFKERLMELWSSGKIAGKKFG